MLSPVERVQCVLQGRRPDRPPVSFWHHFPAAQVCGRAAVDAHLAHLNAFELDFLKVMNDNGYPHAEPLEGVRDLAALRDLRGDEDAFGRQLELLAALRAELCGRVWMTSTVFNAWAVLRHLVRPPREHRPPQMDGTADEPSRWIKSFYAEDPPAVRGALRRINTNLARFARHCIAAGADGIYLAVRDDWVDLPAAAGLYDALVRPGDLEILAGASAGRFNLLHVCGRPVDFPAFANYPVHAINWADRVTGPTIAEVSTWLRPAICAGLDNLTTLSAGSPEDCEREVADARRQAGSRPIMIAAGCTYDPACVPPANLAAVCSAVRHGEL
jgi:uroporphyrinogen decarboxylase